MGVFVSLRRTVGIAFALVLLIPLGSAVSDAQERDPKLAVKSLPRPERPRDPKQRSFDPHAVLVKFKPGTSAAAKDGAVKGRGARMAGAVSGTSYEKVTSAGSADDLLRAMRADSTVASVSLDYRRTMTAAPNDPGYVLGDQNYLNTVRLPQAWDQTKGSTDQIIAVVDSGGRRAAPGSRRSDRGRLQRHHQHTDGGQREHRRQRPRHHGRRHRRGQHQQRHRHRGGGLERPRHAGQGSRLDRERLRLRRRGGHHLGRRSRREGHQPLAGRPRGQHRPARRGHLRDGQGRDPRGVVRQHG
jgi:hypothetical protein